MYIQDPSHLGNFIKKVFEENLDQINPDEVLSIDFIVDKVYKGNVSTLPDIFSWDLRNNPALIEEDNFLKWYAKKNIINTLFLDTIIHIVTPEFSNRLKSLQKINGVYSFWTKKNTSLYIGMSSDLQNRIVCSFRERFSKYNKPIYLKVCVCKTGSDAALMEVFFINKFKPALNGNSKYNDEITIKLIGSPDFEEPILCNHVSKKK